MEHQPGVHSIQACAASNRRILGQVPIPTSPASHHSLRASLAQSRSRITKQTVRRVLLLLTYSTAHRSVFQHGGISSGSVSVKRFLPGGNVFRGTLGIVPVAHRDESTRLNTQLCNRCLALVQ